MYFLSSNDFVSQIQDFLQKRLRLSLRPQKVLIKTLASGVDFLGWVHFSNRRVFRTVTKKRMMKKLRENPSSEAINSSLGLLKRGNTGKLRQEVFRNLVIDIFN